MPDCLFCRIASKEIPAQIVFEDERVLIFKDINPCAEHHYLIIPKTHIENLNAMEDSQQELFGEILFNAAKLAKQLGFSEDGYRVVANTNENGGQTVYHFHMHLIAGRKLSWPPG